MREAPGRILVTVDFSEPSAVALEAAYVLARRLRGRVHVIHATTLPPFVEPGLAVRMATDSTTTTVEALALKAATENLNALLSKHPSPPDVPVTHAVAYGLPLEVIERESRRFDLVVVGTHGRTGIDHLFVGSVAERVVRHVDRPVLVARTLPTEVKRVLVPVDFSDPSRAAFEYGAVVAREFEAELRLLHVIAAIPALSTAELMVIGGADEPTIALHDYARWKAQEDIWRFLSSVAAGRHASVDVRIGDPASEIIASAEECKADLVVMGTHGGTDWAWVGVGSVAEQVVRHAPCSVLTTRWIPAPVDEAEAPSTTSHVDV